MNPNFHTIIETGDEERRGLFLTAAARLGTAVQNVEKARLFFDSADLGLDAAMHGTFTLVPSQPMRESLARDLGQLFGFM